MMEDKIEFITASAGSGKTYRLVDVVFEAISSDESRPDGVVATTFTVAAANELKERLAERFYEKGLTEQATLLRAGMIGTVHGVCLELLTRFSIEAGLSPEVSILDAAQEALLLSRAFDLAIGPETSQRLYQLSDRLGQKNSMDGSYRWRKTVREIVSDARGNDIAPADLPAMGAASWEEMRAVLPEPVAASEREALDQALVTAIQSALSNFPADPKTKTSKSYRSDLHATLRQLNRGDLPWSKWTQLAKAAPGKAEEELCFPVQEAASAYETHPGLHADLEEYLSLLFTTASKLADQYQSLKRERGTADYADLEKEALDLLRHSTEVRSILEAEIDLLVVDEFQDTSPIQLALFSELARCAKRVVWVGDVKQSIYAFRGADPDLIISAVAGAEKAGTLDTSWRSSPDLVHLVNGIFAEPFADHLNLPEEEVALKPHRHTAEGAAPAVRLANITSGIVQKNGKTKALTKSDNQYSGKKAQRPSPVADAVQAFLAASEQVVDKASITIETPGGELRPVRARDVALLVRKNDNAVAIAEALRDRGIEVSLATAGLLATPECTLALACLRRLVDRRDALASAEIIALEAQHAPETWLRDRLLHQQSIANLPEGEFPPEWGTSGDLISPALVAIEAARDPANHLLSPLALYDLATSAADVPRIAARWGRTQARVQQRHANLSALRDLIIEFVDTARSAGSPATINSLFAWLETLAEDKVDARPVDADIDAVHVGTYHTAKGLEWPVVFAEDLDSDTRTRLFSLRPTARTAPLDLDDPLAGRGLRLWINPFDRSKPPLLETLEHSEEGQLALAAARAEDLRLLYVGLTRARDTLVLVHDPGTSPAWLDVAAAEELIDPETTALTYNQKSIQRPITEHVFAEHAPTPGSAKQYEVAARSATLTTGRAPLFITPSSQPSIEGATIAETIEFGTRLDWPSGVNDRDFGDAMHRIIAAEINNPTHPDREQRAHRILAHWSLEKSFTPQRILETVDQYRAWVAKTFSPSSEQTEVPFTHTNPAGQQSTGFIDHLLTTNTDARVIIDHKVFPGQRDQWETRALSYSGQLAMYAEVVGSGATWIHFASAGAALKIGKPDTSN